MRHFIIIGILCLFAQASFSQAADNDAIDLSAKMDTIARGTGENQSEIDPAGNLNVGLKNSDQWEDFELLYVNGNPFSKLRFGGPFLFDTLNNPQLNANPISYADLDGDGIGDLTDFNGNNFYKGKKGTPYFDDTATAQFIHHWSVGGGAIIGTIDYDMDGYNDAVMVSSAPPFVMLELFRGEATFNKNGSIILDDSLLLTFPDTLKLFRITTGIFGKNQKPVIIFGAFTDSAGVQISRIGIIKNAKKLSQDSVIWLSSSLTGGIYPANIYATDITGDGITDLIISDNYHIYIFKGGDDFGTYPLTPENAYYTIKSPQLSDFKNFGFVNDFGGGNNSIYACGDITGSGIPYLMVCGTQYDAISGYIKGYAFLYAGGKALDSLYDAIIGIEDYGFTAIDTLHSIDASGKTVVLILDPHDFNDNLYNLNLLISKSTDKIPHKTNPQMLDVRPISFQSSCILQAQAGGGFVRIIINGESTGVNTLHIFNMLGEEVAKREIGPVIGKSIEMFTTSDLADGTYFAELRGDHAHAIIKFPVNRILKEMAPESPVILQMNETIPNVMR